MYPKDNCPRTHIEVRRVPEKEAERRRICSKLASKPFVLQVLFDLGAAPPEIHIYFEENTPMPVASDLSRQYLQEVAPELIRT